MKKAIYWIWGAVIALGSLLLGFLIRQPQVNKLKKQVTVLQKDNSKLISMIEKQQDDFRELLVQHKALKALQHRKKAMSKERMMENLVMQYAIREYITLLLKRVKYEQELTKNEILFYNAFEKVIDGKKISTSDKVKIRDHIMALYSSDIKQLTPCDYNEVLEALEPPKYIFCTVIDKKKKPQYYITEDTSVQVGDMVYISNTQNGQTVGEVVAVQKYREDNAPVPIKKAQHIIRKCLPEEIEPPMVLELPEKKSWQHSWREQAKKEQPAKRKFMEDALAIYLKEHPEEDEL